MTTDNWHHAYREGWGKRLVPEAYAHPAKASYSLAQRIYEHAIAEGWLKPGDCVLDPFGGIGGFAYHALYHGLHFVGVELEQRFVDLGQQNIARWNARYSTLPGWGTATLIQGDSRQLAAMVGEAAGCISSPPYAATELRLTDPERKRAIINQGRIDRGEISGGTGRSGALGASCNGSGYGTDPANLGNLKAGDFDACLASLPFTDFTHSDNGFVAPHDSTRLMANPNGYGTTPGQLGAMPAGGFDAAVSSPPYAELDTSIGNVGNQIRRRSGQGISLVDHATDDYSRNPDNLGNATDFWTAARTIVEQVYTVLRPGAHAIWVLKAYVRDKQIVDFPDQWRQMCEACGFETLHVHRAWLVEDHGAQATLDGGVEKREKRRVSFFRRLHMKKYPHLAIDYEIVLCMRKGDTQ